MLLKKSGKESSEQITIHEHFTEWEINSGYQDIIDQRLKMQEVVDDYMGKSTLGLFTGISLVSWITAPVYDFKEIVLDPFINISISMLFLGIFDDHNHLMAKVLKVASKKFKQQCKQYHESLDTMKENIMHPENQKTIINYIVQLENEGRLPLVYKTSKYYHDIAAEYILTRDMEKLIILLQQVKLISSGCVVPTAYQKIVSQSNSTQHTKQETRWWRKEI